MSAESQLATQESASFADALQHFRNGNFAEAERLCRQIIAADPRHAESLHLLGVLVHQAGQHQAAISLIRQAIALRNDIAFFHNNIAAALRAVGNSEEAITHYRRAVALNPDFGEAHSNLGNALLTLGKVEEAVVHYQRAVDLNPKSPSARNNFGIALRRSGKLVEATSQYERAIAEDPDYAEAYNNLGDVFQEQGRMDDAAAHYQKALLRKPNFPEALNNFGNVLSARGRLAEAIVQYEQAVALSPNYAEAHNNLGNVKRSQGKIDEAIKCYTRAIELKPGFAIAYLNLGAALSDQERVDEAIAVWQQAIKLKPDYGDAYYNLGIALNKKGKLQEAITAFQQAIRLKPNYAEAHNGLGFSLVQRGETKQARAEFETAVRLAPQDGRYRYNLSDTRRYTRDDPQLIEMQELLRDGASLTIDSRIGMHFALAKAYQDIGQYQQAFKSWFAGNTLKRSQLPYNEAVTLQELDAVQAAFPAEFIARMQNVGNPSQLPVFIVGMPRSGSTLVEQILASHPRIIGAGELTHFGDLVGLLAPSLGSSAGIASLASKMTAADFHDLGTRYLAELQRLAPEAARITDKMPNNFIFSGFIHLALPNAAIIHTIRNPADTCLSCYSKLFVQKQYHTYDLAELGRYYRHYQALMAHWHKVLPSGRILDVRYEDVVADLEGQARRIIAHCGLEWDPRCLSFHETQRPVRTASAVQVRQPIYGSSVERWRTYKDFLGPLLKELQLDA